MNNLSIDIKKEVNNNRIIKPKLNFSSLLSFKTFMFFVFLLLTSVVFGQDAYLDDFSAVSYANNDGTLNFSSNWVETGDDNNAGGGWIRIHSNALLLNNVDSRTISRSLDLSLATSVKLSFNYYAQNRGNETLLVQLWNSTTLGWETVVTLNQSITSDVTYTLTAAQISANSQIRFVSGSGGWSTSEYIFIDNVMFYSYDPSIPFNQPLTLVEQFNGYTDYSITGGTLRTEDNTGDYCAITTSSSNTLTSPLTAGAVIEKAYLYWTHSGLTPDSQVTFEGQTVNADTSYGSDIIASRIFYGFVSDVTSIVNNVANPSTNVFDFTDLTVDTSNIYCSNATVLGGWALYVFYSDTSLPASSINLYQGFNGESNSSSSFTLSGFFAIGSSGAKTTVLSWEGDSNLDGSSSGSTNPEALSVTNQSGTTSILSGDGGQTGNNAYNSTIYDDTTSPIYNTNTSYGLDLDTFNLSSYISAGDSQITTNVDSGQDFIIVNALTLKVPSNLIQGTVFEDINYGGGVGRSLATSSGTPIEGVTVELYDNTGTLIDTKITNTSGGYVFAGMINGTYNVRVVNSTVNSTRIGGAACATCISVQTFKNNFASSTLTSVTNEVGGASPSGQDVAAGTLTGVQSISTVTISNEGAVGIDFGFNFNTIVNTNKDGQGSLEQFIVNANNLDETGLDIEANSIFNPAAGEDTSIFMIPPTGDALGRTADTNYTSGVFNILQNAAINLPIITDSFTHIDGRTQTAYSGDSNAGTVGSGGTNVGVSAIALPNYNLPEIQIHRNNGDVIQIQANSTVIRNVSIYANNNAGIRIDSGSADVTNAIIGVNALGVNAGNIDYGVEITGGTAVINGNYIATTTDAGILVNGGTSTIIQNNHITVNGSGACTDNIVLQSGSGIVIQQNLIDNAAAIGIDGWYFSGGATIDENTITNSGQNGGNCSGSIENAGIRLYGNNSTITSNIINSNGGAGVVITGGNTSGNLISQNSIYNNGTTTDALGIDIDQSTTGNPVGDGVTLNDTGDSDSGPNTSINFPVFESIVFYGTNLKVKGWARPGADIELFITDISEGTASVGDNQLGLTQDYGEGQTYLTTLTEGSGSDLSGASSSYTDADGNTDNTNEFEFTISIPSGVIQGTVLTATATIGNSTSEFSPSFTVVASADLSLTKIVDNSSPDQGDNITFTLTVANIGPSEPTSIIVKDIIPTEFTYTHPNFVTTQGTVTFNAGTREFEWDLGAYVLALGNNITLTYTVTVDICGEFINQAEITNSSLADPDSTTNSGG